jgi:putative endonuclease
VTKQSIKQPAIYIVTNRKNGTLYTGVTSDLIKRIHQHKSGEIKGFTQRYGCKILIYYELYETMENAILREKQIKGGSRDDKIDLILKTNPDWLDLYESLL